ncbi:transposase [Candidatus Nitrospira nitrosa]|uniref:Transposase n=1 Tax=Candidatus Nitrospira nitrosa TaxID=1742972 RepID=A0A0S4LRX7_9BACT|nr:IS630 family transposase [Candidatus Nitrospira nitrosa]CUS39320.1 transposase [Candidatus Nitrospira nitrosa]
MKRDGRTLDHRTLETIRTMAVARVRDGERPSTVIASYGFHRCTIYRWLKTARRRGQGLKALAARPATGRPRTLTAGQERQMFRWINGKNPMQYGFDFGLWTRQIVRDLIAQRFGVRLSLASVGAVLARQGLTPQKPLQRAYQRDPAAIARWQRETYPAIVRRAKRDQAEIYFWDESGFRADAVQGRTWGAKGQTPVVSVPGQRQSISAASAITTKGAFWVETYTGGLTGEQLVTLLRRMLRGRRKPLHLILDGLPAHKTKAVTQYIADLAGKLTLHYLPGYAPDLNPDELVWSYAKRTGTARRPLRKGETLDAQVTRQLMEIGRRPALVRSFFHHPSVAYISDF